MPASCRTSIASSRCSNPDRTTPCPSPERSHACSASPPSVLAVSSTAFETPAAWSVSRQMIVVTTDGWDVDHGTLRAYVREGTRWKQEGPAAEVTIGKHGSALGRRPQSTRNATDR